jgi:hypothetical protein
MSSGGSRNVSIRSHPHHNLKQVNGSYMVFSVFKDLRIWSIIG